MNRFSNESLKSYFEPWEHEKESIEQLYEEKDSSVVKHMEEAIHRYIRLLEYGGMEENELTGTNEYRLLPLNGQERIEFIQKQVHSPYAFVQLSALYEETRKKAARLNAMKKNIKAD